jgi:intron-binding protein aquarius
MAFKKFSNMEQSLFTRFIRLGVPAVQLDAQGRARGSLCELYKWRYKQLGNLPHTSTLPEFTLANPGFQYDYQLIDVPDFNGVGEMTPSIHFFQNLAEAEYVVAVYMYMRLLGYAAQDISILTTYNGQKELIRDVATAKCGGHPMFGMPDKVR